VSDDWREASLRSRLADLEARGLSRRRRLIEDYGRAGDSVMPRIGGRLLLSFSSNDYLGLARHPALVRAFQQAAGRDGVGSGASHLITGHHREHHALEEELATYAGRERAVLFSTGYMANLAVGTVLGQRDGLVLEDALNHASLLDAGRLSGARFERYAHGDAAAAATALANSAEGAALVLTDGLFSMDGDVAPVGALARICRDARAWLAVDDAHGLGVVGPTGRGVLEATGLAQDDVPVLIGTLGKAFGCFGAFVAGSNALCDLLVNRARTLIFTTALPPAVAAAARCALRLADEEPWRRERLRTHVARFTTACRELGLPLLPSMTPIQPLVLGGNEATLAASSALLELGILVTAIRPPTVPVNTARLRITFSAAHTEADVDRLIEALAGLRLQVAA
jgi:8-amino-7-oxononanoate synthase